MLAQTVAQTRLGGFKGVSSGLALLEGMVPSREGTRLEGKRAGGFEGAAADGLVDPQGKDLDFKAVVTLLGEQVGEAGALFRVEGVEVALMATGGAGGAEVGECACEAAVVELVDASVVKKSAQPDSEGVGGEAALDEGEGGGKRRKEAFVTAAAVGEASEGRPTAERTEKRERENGKNSTSAARRRGGSEGVRRVWRGSRQRGFSNVRGPRLWQNTNQPTNNFVQQKSKTHRHAAHQPACETQPALSTR